MPEVVQHAAIWGLASGRSSPSCGPFSAEFNAAFYRQCRADVVVTKASAEGGYQEKYNPVLMRGSPGIVITRPAPLVMVTRSPQSQADFTARLTRWLSAT
ncbi:precorrin-6A/cobalt-precorrin-6A reductase [Klebsiella pneumoniae]